MKEFRLYSKPSENYKIKTLFDGISRGFVHEYDKEKVNKLPESVWMLNGKSIIFNIRTYSDLRLFHINFSQTLILSLRRNG